MLATIQTLDRWAEVWLKAMTAVLWQSALLIVLATIVAWFLRRSSPTVRYWLWQIVAIKLLLMPFWSLAVPVPAWWESKSPPVAETPRPVEPIAKDIVPKATPGSAVEMTEPVKETTSSTTSFWALLGSITWQAWLMVVWFVVVVGQILRIFLQRYRLSRLLARGRATDGVPAALVAELSGQIGIRRVPASVSIDGDCPLFVCGLLRPTLVLPDRLLASLDAAERRQVILHELGHVKRHDLAWGWTAEIARIVYFFHPLVYWLAYQLRLERELACDQLAMAHSGHSAADYARTLVQVVSRAVESAAPQTAAISAGLTGSQPVKKPISSTEES